VSACDGSQIPGIWLGDGYCDEGAFFWEGMSIVMNCPALECDGGDCGMVSDGVTCCVPEAMDTCGVCNGSGESCCGSWDATEDDAVNVLDVVFLVTAILQVGITSDLVCQMDVTCDDALNILDVVGLVTFILNPGNTPGPGSCP